MHFLQFYRRVKAWTEAHFLYEAHQRFIQNVLRSALLHANKTTKKCIQFLNKMLVYHIYVFFNNFFYQLYHLQFQMFQMLSSFIDVLICIVCKQSITDNKFKGNILLLQLYTYLFIEKLPWEIMDHLGSALVFVGFMIFILSIVGFTTTYTL